MRKETGPIAQSMTQSLESKTCERIILEIFQPEISLLKKTYYAVPTALPANGLQAWEEADASELYSIGKVKIFS
jgi:hypothetical protein